MGFFEDADSAKAKAYIAAADSQDNVFFGIVTKSEVAESLEAKFDSIVVFKKFDEGRSTYEGEYNAEDIVKFVISEQLPLLTVFSDQVSQDRRGFCYKYYYRVISSLPPRDLQTAPKIFGGDVRTHLLAFFSSEDENAEKYTADLKSVAKEYKGDVSLTLPRA